MFSVVQSVRLRPNSRGWKQRQSDRQRSVAVASHILRILDPAFPHYGFISILQKDPESESVRDEQQRHNDSRNEIVGSQLPCNESRVVGLVESI